MPGFDQTGPNGRGPMTGRGLGKCADNSENASGNAGRMRRDNRMGGRGFGFRKRFGQNVMKDEQGGSNVHDLKNEISIMRQHIQELEGKLNELLKK